MYLNHTLCECCEGNEQDAVIGLSAEVESAVWRKNWLTPLAGEKYWDQISFTFTAPMPSPAHSRHWIGWLSLRVTHTPYDALKVDNQSECTGCTNCSAATAQRLWSTLLYPLPGPSPGPSHGSATKGVIVAKHSFKTLLYYSHCLLFQCVSAGAVLAVKYFRHRPNCQNLGVGV